MWFLTNLALVYGSALLLEVAAAEAVHAETIASQDRHLVFVGQ